MSRHASVIDLALFIEGTLRARKTAKISSHLTGCTQCTGHLHQLRRVSVLLGSASVSYPAMSPQFSARIELAIAAESVTRVAADPAPAPATSATAGTRTAEPVSAEPAGGEASRRDLPVRSKPPRRRWHMPGLSSPLAGSLAAVGAAVVIAGGGFEIATHLSGPQVTASSSSGSGAGAVAPAHSGPASQGNAAMGRSAPVVRSMTIRQHGVTHSVQVVQTTTKFLPAHLRAQALSALAAARATSLNQAAGTLASPSPVPGGVFATGTNAAQLAGCVSKVANGRNVLLVDMAYYQDKSATIIVVGTPPKGPGTIYVLAAGCSADHPNVLAQRAFPAPSP